MKNIRLNNILVILIINISLFLNYCSHTENIENLDNAFNTLEWINEYDEVLNNFFIYTKNNDLEGILTLYSKEYINKYGLGYIISYIKDEVIPFFKIQKAMLTHINANYIDSLGNAGRATFSYSVDIYDNNKPFVIILILEDNKFVITDIHVNKYFEDGHFSQEIIDEGKGRYVYPDEEGRYFKKSIY